MASNKAFAKRVAKSAASRLSKAIKSGARAGVKASGRKGACKPTLKLTGTTGARYKEMCNIYAETRKAYHALGRKAMGTSEKSPTRKLYEQTKKDYKKIGKALFKMGHPKSEWNSQHKR